MNLRKLFWLLRRYEEKEDMSITTTNKELVDFYGDKTPEQVAKEYMQPKDIEDPIAEAVNYMHIEDKAHCYFCHKDHKPSEDENHSIRHYENKDPNLGPCDALEHPLEDCQQYIFKQRIEGIFDDIIIDEENSECNVSYYKENYVKRTECIIRDQNKALLTELIDEIKSRKVPLREESDHLPNVYRHLKGKNEAFDDIIAIIKAKI